LVHPQISQIFADKALLPGPVEEGGRHGNRNKKCLFAFAHKILLKMRDFTDSIAEKTREEGGVVAGKKDRAPVAVSSALI